MRRRSYPLTPATDCQALQIFLISRGAAKPYPPLSILGASNTPTPQRQGVRFASGKNFGQGLSVAGRKPCPARSSLGQIFFLRPLTSLPAFSRSPLCLSLGVVFILPSPPFFNQFNPPQWRYPLDNLLPLCQNNCQITQL